MRWLSNLRTILHGGSDRARAVLDEERAIAAHARNAETLPRRLKYAFGSEAPDSILLGQAVELGFPVRLPLAAMRAHGQIAGPTGCGKSYFLTAVGRGLLETGDLRQTVLDPKSETVALRKRAIASVGKHLDGADREALYRRTVLIDLFGGTALPHMNALAPVPGLDTELQAYEVALLLTAGLEQTVGVRQEAATVPVVECLIRAELPLTVLPAVLEAPVLLERLAERAGPAELFRATARRLAKESKDRILGVQSRVERILRLKAARLALGARDCIDFGDLLEGLSLVDLAPPQGAAAVGRVFSGLLWLGLSHAIRRRPNGSPPSHLHIDEFPTFLAASGAHVADSVEELLRLARSKGVFLTTLSQDVASIAKVSSTLPEVLRVNAHLFGMFRCLTDGHWDFLLPVTGKRKKPRRAPWEDGERGYLERGAELVELRSQFSRLPDREFLLADRRSGLPGIRVRTADLRLEADDRDVQELEAVARRHPLLTPVAELERGYDETMRMVHGLLDEAGRRAGCDDERAPLRRAQGRLGIG